MVCGQRRFNDEVGKTKFFLHAEKRRFFHAVKLSCVCFSEGEKKHACSEASYETGALVLVKLLFVME